MYGVLFDVYWHTLKGWSLKKNKVKCVRSGKVNLNSEGMWIDNVDWNDEAPAIFVSNSTQQWDRVWENVS